MPRIKAECDYCGTECDDLNLHNIDLQFGKCTECNSDICDNCGKLISDSIHPECKEKADWEEND